MQHQHTNWRRGTGVFQHCILFKKQKQMEDRERHRRINHVVNKRLLRIEAEVQAGTQSRDEIQEGFMEGLYCMLRALNAAYSRCVISCTM